MNLNNRNSLDWFVSYKVWLFPPNFEKKNIQPSNQPSPFFQPRVIRHGSRASVVWRRPHPSWSSWPQRLELADSATQRSPSDAKSDAKRDAICANRLENRLNQTPRFQWLGWLIMMVDNDGWWGWLLMMLMMLLMMMVYHDLWPRVHALEWKV